MKPQLTIEDLQKAFEDQTNVPFVIIGASLKGYHARIFDFKAFVSFHYMPFEYYSTEAWQAMLPHLKRNVFFGKIASIEGHGEYYILNAKVPQFKKEELSCDSAYEGIVIERNQRYLLLELGASLGWKLGSVKAIMPRSKRDTIKHFGGIAIGDKMQVRIYDRSIDTRQYLVKGTLDFDDWENGNVQEMLNKMVSAKVVYHGARKLFIVEEKYRGAIITDRKWYKDTEYRWAIKGIVNSLEEGAEIICRVIKVVEESRILKLLWMPDQEEFKSHFDETRNTIGNILDDSFKSKLIKND
jgi:hypothetical protein